MEPVEYPLTWPDNMPRTSNPGSSRFKASLKAALTNVRDSLRRFSVDTGRKLQNVIISSNVTLGEENPKDAGVAVWFVWDGRQVCFAVDRYQKVSDNLQAIHHIIEARRTEMRHGGINIVRATFTGFQALPAPHGGGPSSRWRFVLGFDNNAQVTPDQIERQYRKLSKTRHPDSPTGSTGMMAELNVAKEEALREIGSAN